MKITKSILALTLLSCGVAASAVVPGYGEPRLINVPTEVYHPVLSPDGSRLLFSTVDHTGLKSLELKSGKITLIDASAAAGFDPVFSPDGDKVYYRTAVMSGGLLHRDVRCYDMATSRSVQLEKPDRKFHALKAIDSRTYIAADFDQMNLSLDGTVARLNPVADAHCYQWPSISPDGTRILFSEPFKGVFVCNIDGTGAKAVLPKGDYPSWVDDNTVAAVVSHDDGYIVLDSAVVLVDLNSGESVNVTSPDVIVGELTSSPSTRSVAYTTTDGELYIINPKN